MHLHKNKENRKLKCKPTVYTTLHMSKPKWSCKPCMPLWLLRLHACATCVLYTFTLTCMWKLHIFNVFTPYLHWFIPDFTCNYTPLVSTIRGSKENIIKRDFCTYTSWCKFTLFLAQTPCGVILASTHPCVIRNHTLYSVYTQYTSWWRFKVK